MDVTIIMRARNEETYLRATLDAIFSQDFSGDYELIFVDNCSSDNSRNIASEYTHHILTIDEYTPGKVLNVAIEESCGKMISILSAHTIPANRKWLQNLYSYANIPNLGGVYGAQLYPINSKFLDKRDLDVFSTLSPRVEIHDTDFWNANSMFPRAVWMEQHFDEGVFELEDHYWTKLLTLRGYRFYFEPQALVYHYSHISRIDREHLSVTYADAESIINQSVRVLQNPDSNWSLVMQAGLTLSSLTRYEYIQHATTALGETMLNHPDFDVRWRMAQALGKIPNQASVTYLIKALNDESYYPRDEAAWSLARLGSLSVPHLMEVIDSLPTEKAIFAGLSLGRSCVAVAEEKAVNFFLQVLSSNDLLQLCNAVYFAGELALTKPAMALIRPINSLLLSTTNSRLAMICCWALGEFSQTAAYLVDWSEIHQHAYTDPFLLTRFEAVVAMGKRAISLGDSSLLSPVINCLKDPSSRVRYGAIQSVRLMIENCQGNAPENLDKVIKWRDHDNGIRFEQSLITHCIENGGK